MSLCFEWMTNLDSNRYCMPMDSPRPILPSELDFFDKGTGKGKWIQSIFWLYWKLAITSTVPLVVVFTKFDGQVIQESGKLNDIQDDGAKWDMARKNAEITFQKSYLPKVMNTQYPPKGYVRLEGENKAIPCFDRDITFTRYGYTRKWLSWIEWEDSLCNWWCQSTRTVCLNTNEQS